MLYLEYITEKQVSVFLVSLLSILSSTFRIH